MSSNEQQNHESQGGGFGYNPFSFFQGKPQADMRSFDEILKEFEDFFQMDKSKNSQLKARDIF